MVCDRRREKEVGEKPGKKLIQRNKKKCQSKNEKEYMREEAIPREGEISAIEY